MLRGRLLSLSQQAIVIILNDSLINLRTLIKDKPADCLVDSGALHNFLSTCWCKNNGVEYEEGDWFNVWLADGQEVPAVGRLRFLVDLGPMKIALTFYILDCNAPCVLGISFLQTVNPIIDWVHRTVSVTTVNGLCLVEVINYDLALQCEIVSAK